MVFISIIIFFKIFYFISSKDRLVFLYTHFRHGARAPTKVNKNLYDNLKEYWTNPGELTGVGQRMLYLLGLRNRIKYIKNQQFLSEKFDAHEILIYSSDYNRTLVSCSSQLQGLYPQKDLKGEILNNDQIDIAYPRVNINYDEIIEEIKNLGNYSLPYNMILSPVRMISNNDRKFHMHKLEGCDKVKDEITQKNIEHITYISEEVKKFNEKYGKRLNHYYNTENIIYTYDDISVVCDSVVPAYADARKCTEFKNAGFDLEEMNEYCWGFFRIKHLYEIHGDDEKIYAHIEASRMLREVLYYMKRRLDADITEENEDENIKDYSRPRMLMISGHDTTVSSDEIILIKALGLNENETFVSPKFSTQLALEVKAKNSGKTSKYSDYYVVGYIDDKEIFNFPADEFIDKVEKELWSDDKIDEVCEFNKDKNNDDSNNHDNNDRSKTYKTLMIIFIIISFIFILSTIYLGYKYSKLKRVPLIEELGEVVK